MELDTYLQLGSRCENGCLALLYQVDRMDLLDREKITAEQILELSLSLQGVKESSTEGR